MLTFRINFSHSGTILTLSSSVKKGLKPKWRRPSLINNVKFWSHVLVRTRSLLLCCYLRTCLKAIIGCSKLRKQPSLSRLTKKKSLKGKLLCWLFRDRQDHWTRSNHRSCCNTTSWFRIKWCKDQLSSKLLWSRSSSIWSTWVRRPSMWRSRTQVGWTSKTTASSRILSRTRAISNTLRQSLSLKSTAKGQ